MKVSTEGTASAVPGRLPRRRGGALTRETAETSARPEPDGSGGGRIRVSHVKLEHVVRPHGGRKVSSIFWDVVHPVDPANSFWLDSSSWDAMPLKSAMKTGSGTPVDPRSRFSYMGSRGGSLWRRVSFKLDAAPSADRDTQGQFGDTTGTANDDSTGVIEIEDRTGSCSRFRGRFFEYLEDRLSELTANLVVSGASDDTSDEGSAPVPTTAVHELPFDFWGGYVGYMGYELKAECEGGNVHQSRLPDGVVFLADRVVAVDHVDGCVYLVTLTKDGDEDDEAEAIRWIEDVKQRILELRSPGEGGETTPARVSWRGEDGAGFRGGLRDAAVSPVRFSERHDAPRYLQDILACKDSILDGDSYELCLTNELSIQNSTGDGDHIRPSDYYGALREINPAPYAAFLTTPGHGKGTALSICCSSPERFLKLHRDGTLEAKPIKGTARREPDHLGDALARGKLHTSKEHAENLMIVDLLRNDLSRVCDLGSVRVPKLMDVETYASVHQLVSTVTGKRARSSSPIQCVKAAFPGGSMTGAPKIRSMHILDDTEGGPRGVYSGSLGFFSVNGTFDLNIVIRTAVFESKESERSAGGCGPDAERVAGGYGDDNIDGVISIGAGGAITLLSDPQAELDEVMLKAQPLLLAANVTKASAMKTRVSAARTA